MAHKEGKKPAIIVYVTPEQHAHVKDLSLIHISRYQDATLSAASLRLADAMQLAIDTFEGVMKNSTASDAAKVSAARAVLDGGLRAVSYTHLDVYKRQVIEN